MNEENAQTAAPLVLVDLGKQKRTRIKKLRKGEGKLYDKVLGVIDELREQGVVGADAQPVVILVKEKEELGFPLSGVFR